MPKEVKQPVTQLERPCSNTHSMGNKQQHLEATVQLEHCGQSLSLQRGGTNCMAAALHQWL